MTNFTLTLKIRSLLDKTSSRLPDDCLITAWQLPDDCLKTSWRLPDDFLTTARRLLDDCLTTAWQLPDDFLKTTWWLPDNRLGLYRTSLSGPKVSKSGLTKNRTFFFPDAGLLSLEKNGKKSKKKKKKKFKFQISKFFSKFFFCLFIWPGNFWHQICVHEPYVMRSNNL